MFEGGRETKRSFPPVGRRKMEPLQLQKQMDQRRIK